MFISPDDLNKVFRECNTKIVVTIDELVPKVNEARTGLDHIKVRPFFIFILVIFNQIALFTTY